MNKFIDAIHRKLALGPVLTALDRKLSMSELNTFLMELFRRKTGRIDPAHILRQFGDNRFVRPAEVDALAMRQTELDWLTFARERQFEPLILSPLAPLGACSVVGHVDQNNVVSALRGTEVVSDATNVLALQIAADFRRMADKNVRIRYATVHRHVRGQAFDNPRFSAHFSVFCLASGGLASGRFDFELELLNDHLTVLHALLAKQFGEESLLVRFYLKKGASAFREALAAHEPGIWQGLSHEFRDDPGHAYYDLIQFKIYLKLGDQMLDLADGGLVDWTQRLLSNRRQRLFISGIGLELVHKLGMAGK